MRHSRLVSPAWRRGSTTRRRDRGIVDWREHGRDDGLAVPGRHQATGGALDLDAAPSGCAAQHVEARPDRLVLGSRAALPELLSGVEAKQRPDYQVHHASATAGVPGAEVIGRLEPAMVGPGHDGCLATRVDMTALVIRRKPRHAIRVVRRHGSSVCPAGRVHKTYQPAMTQKSRGQGRTCCMQGQGVGREGAEEVRVRS